MKAANERTHRMIEIEALLVRLRRFEELEAAARAVLTDDDLTAIIANTTAYENWVRHRAALAALLDPG
jgi:hypothetical protein